MRHAPRERVSWNRKTTFVDVPLICHAPRERVSWNNFINFQDTTGISHAPRERVSWNRRYLQTEELSQVTLHVSVWVEMPLRDMMWTKRLVTLHVSVWVEIPLKLLVLLPPRSRSTWACELKFNVSPAIVKGNVSRSTWACELKYLYLAIQNTDIGHAPRERVSWNLCRINSRLTWLVTLHVSVWVNFRFNAGLIDIE